MNRNSALLNQAVVRARKVITRQLMARMVHADDGIRIYWDAGLFGEDEEVRET